jgi:hypothetical protein
MQMNLINSRNALPEAAKHIQQTRCLSYSRNAYPVAEMPIQQPSCLFSRRKAYPTAKMFDQKLSSLSRKKSFLAKYRKIPLWYSSGSYKKIKPPPIKIPRICKILLDETSSDEDNEWFSYLYPDKDDRRNIFSYIYAMEEDSDTNDEFDSNIIMC